MQDHPAKREFEGVDLEEALHAASKRLGIPEPDLDYEIVEQGRRGLFGIGAKPVRIRVMPPLDEEIPDPNRRPRQPRRERKRSSAKPAAKPKQAAKPAAATEGGPASAPRVDGAATEDGGEEPRRRRRSRNRRRRSKRRGDGAQREGAAATAESGNAEAKPARQREDGRPAKREGSRRRSRSKRSSGDRSAPEKPRVQAPPADPAQVAAVQDTLQQMIELIGLEVTANPGDAGSGVRLELDGPDRKALMRKEAELLAALQFVLNRMSRRAWPDAGRIQLACNGHRTRRDDDVTGLVEQALAALRETGEPQQLREMNAYERRLVHIKVRQLKGVQSRSEGDGHLKQVLLFQSAADGAPDDDIDREADVDADVQADAADPADAEVQADAEVDVASEVDDAAAPTDESADPDDKRQPE